MTKQYSFGAMAPPGLEWQVGKTAATIQWVRYLESNTHIPHVNAVIQALKNGTMTATTFPPDMK